MADIFLSYSRTDRDKAEQIAHALEAEGFSVWWDKVLRAGETYDEVTEGMLRDSKVVVVLWSQESVKSKWVRAEATLGQRSSAVVPAQIEECDRPIMFELLQTADLVGWDGDREDPRWRAFVEDINLAIARVEDEKHDDLGADDTLEVNYWSSIKESREPKDFRTYIKRYPKGRFIDQAKRRLAQLEGARAGKGGGGLMTAAAALLVVAGLGGGGWYFYGDRLGEITLPGVKMPAFGVGEAAEAEAEGPVTFADCRQCPEMTVIPAGSFLMGSPPEEVGGQAWERPQRDVQVNGFALARTEVTFDMWETCVRDGGCRDYRPSDREFGRGDQPVLGISWNDAQAFVDWMSERTGRVYRLPSEAEWEYAARAGAQTRYWWGDVFDEFRVPMQRPRPASALPQDHPFGLVGIAGNVREWTQDCYVGGLQDRPADAVPVSEGDCSLRVVRGGAWNGEPNDFRSANRVRFGVDIRDRSLGFRVASSNTTPPAPPPASAP